MKYVITQEQISSIVEAINCAALRLEVLEMYKEKTENTKIVLQFLKDAKGELKYIEDNEEQDEIKSVCEYCGRSDKLEAISKTTVCLHCDSEF